MKKLFYLLFLLPFVMNSQVNSKYSRTKEEARNFIDSLRNEMIKGGSFEAMAALYSEDPGSGRKGGQLSPFTKGQMVPEFETMAFSLPVGSLSEVFETKFGFHVLQVLARENEKVSARHILISYKQ